MRELVCPRHMCKVPLGKCMEWDIDEVTGERIQCNEKPVMSTTLYWCKQCNVPIYEESCPLCGEKGKYIATDIRPVFPEEKILLAILLEKDDPLCFEELSVWNNTNFYFIDGEKIQVSIKDFNGKTLDEIQKIKKKYDEYSAQIDYSKFDKIVSRFIQANENRYNEVTDEAISFVQGYKERYSLEDMFVSFSGGKDSTVTSDIVRRAFSSNKVYHIFGDTTLEFPLTYEYKGILNEIAGNSNTNHQSIIDFKGKSYFIYHNGSINPHGCGFRRAICIDYLHYNQDGTMKRMQMTTEGVVK